MDLSKSVAELQRKDHVMQARLRAFKKKHQQGVVFIIPSLHIYQAGSAFQLKFCLIRFLLLFLFAPLFCS